MNIFNIHLVCITCFYYSSIYNYALLFVLFTQIQYLIICFLSSVYFNKCCLKYMCNMLGYISYWLFKSNFIIVNNWYLYVIRRFTVQYDNLFGRVHSLKRLEYDFSSCVRVQIYPVLYICTVKRIITFLFYIQ